MAIEIRSTPVLTGETAERFVREAENNFRNPQKKKLRVSFDDVRKLLERSAKYVREHEGQTTLSY